MLGMECPCLTETMFRINYCTGVCKLDDRGLAFLHMELSTLYGVVGIQPFSEALST